MLVNFSMLSAFVVHPGVERSTSAVFQIAGPNKYHILLIIPRFLVAVACMDSLSSYFSGLAQALKFVKIELSKEPSSSQQLSFDNSN
jgi:hypothetical protein